MYSERLFSLNFLSTSTCFCQFEYTKSLFCFVFTTDYIESPFHTTRTTMVKHKTLPKKGSKAGYAASIEPPVNESSDSSSYQSSASTPPVTTKAKNNRILETKRQSPKQTNMREVAVQKRKVKSGTKALREIRKLQSSTNLLIPRAPFLRLVSDRFFSLSGSLSIEIKVSFDFLD